VLRRACLDGSALDLTVSPRALVPKAKAQGEAGDDRDRKGARTGLRRVRVRRVRVRARVRVRVVREQPRQVRRWGLGGSRTSSRTTASVRAHYWQSSSIL
jgi:hypothetical protein